MVFAGAMDIRTNSHLSNRLNNRDAAVLYAAVPNGE